MKIFVPVFFNAPLGGLQANVFESVKALASAGHECVVMCKAGPFSAMLLQNNFKVVVSEFLDIDEAVRLGIAAGPFDLVCAHPFRSRAVGLEVACYFGVPFILTIHGMYSDGLQSYSNQCAFILAVSPAIRDFLIATKTCAPEKVLLMPNGVCTATFMPKRNESEGTRKQFPYLQSWLPFEGDRAVLFVCRLDGDKDFILNLIFETWTKIIKNRVFNIHWIVAGDGTKREAVVQAAEVLNQAAGRALVHFVGWREPAELCALYQSVDLAICPGRSALEAMACGKATIAVGSKSYVGLIDRDLILAGSYQNFGGFGNREQSYRQGSMYLDILSVIYKPTRLSLIGKIGIKVVSTMFKQSVLNQSFISLCELASVLPGARPDFAQFDASSPLFIHFYNDRNDKVDTKVWNFPQAIKAIRCLNDRWIAMKVAQGQDAFCYITIGSKPFDQPSAIANVTLVEAGRDYLFKIMFLRRDRHVDVNFWIIEYDEIRRINSSSSILKHGENSILFRTSDTAVSIRLAFRISGSGFFVLSPIAVRFLDI